MTSVLSVTYALLPQWFKNCTISVYIVKPYVKPTRYFHCAQHSRLVYGNKLWIKRPVTTCFNVIFFLCIHISWLKLLILYNSSIFMPSCCPHTKIHCPQIYIMPKRSNNPFEFDNPIGDLVSLSYSYIDSNSEIHSVI